MQEKEVNVLKVGISSTRFLNESYEIKDFGFFNIGMELIYNHQTFLFFRFLYNHILRIFRLEIADCAAS